jgi:hypothetical protein
MNSSTDGSTFSITGLTADHPEIMAIGDSLSQGCRSLSVTSRFCSQSCSAVIARSRGWNFVTANYPKAVLIDLEDVLSKVDGFLLVGEIPFVLQGIQNNIAFWNSPAAEWASSQTSSRLKNEYFS